MSYRDSLPRRYSPLFPPASATAHGEQLLQLGYSVNQVVHDYGDLCQAITDLAVELDAPFSVDQFRTLNHCLDNAIADAVTEFVDYRRADRRRSSEDKTAGLSGVTGSTAENACAPQL